ncbi:MAG: hypothetical protein ACRC14_12120 [Paracoccaceae bacterium]
MDQEVVDNSKSSAGGLATIVWLGTAVFLFATDADGPGLISVSAMLFLIAGMFFAAVVLGAAIYVLQRTVGKLLAVSLGDWVYSGFGMTLARGSSIVLLLVDFAIVILTTTYSYQTLIG